MAKYIHKQAAIYALVNEANLHKNPIKRAYARAAAIIEQITAEDVQPVKHGRWTWDSNAPHREHGAYKCSNCGCHSDFEENYCPNCGARMDGDKMDNGNYNIEPIIRRIQETAFTEGYEAGKKEAVKRGYWIDIAGYGGWSNPYFKCSECETTERTPSPFCPNCGADMRGEDDA